MRKALWLKHDAHFGEHPKTLRLRRLAGRHADAAECGWWRIVEGAKRYGEWSFESDEHLDHVAGRYARFIPIYREVGMLDGLTIHNGDEYQAPASGAERVAQHRARNAAAVTDVTPRAEKSREERADQQTARADDPADTYWTLTGKYPTDKTLAWIDDLSEQYGATTVSRFLATEHQRDRDARTLMGRVTDLCRRSGRELGQQERAAERAKAQTRRNVGVLRAYHNSGHHVDAPADGCPLCIEGDAA